MIIIDYIASKQLCKISTDTVDKTWLQIRFHYNQISNQSEIYESSIELPWHSFISNVDLLRFVVSLYNIEVKFSDSATELYRLSLESTTSVESIESAKALNEEEIKANLSAKYFTRNLTNEQIRNVSKLSRLAVGATFSVPGAGKTTEAIAFYLLHKKPGQGLLVICPKNAFPAWEEQFAECLKAHSPKIIRLTDGIDKIEKELKNTDCVFIISYQQFVRAVEPIAKYLHDYQTFVFIDESHRMKGGNRTDTGRQIQKIAHLPIGKLIMSGTPLPQGISDLIPQYSFLFPTDGNINEENIGDKIKRIYVRTTKIELGLDDPTIIITPIPFSEPQKNLYDLIRSEEVRQLSNIGSNDKKFYRQLGRSYMRLLQVTSKPALLLKSANCFPDAVIEAIEYGKGNKIEYVAIKARQLAKEGKKVLIWSGFVENIESLTQMLSDLGAKCIHGGVDAGSEDEENTRERIVKDFHDDPNMYVLVANPAACSEGISLHQICHHAIYLDRNYNAAQFLQSMDRIHRFGLPPGTTTTIEIVKSPNSIDELVDTRLRDKITRMFSVLQDESLRVEPVTVELDEDGFDAEDAKQLLRHLKGLL
jgi:SNF2 family DNA or RNA helicase